MFKNKFILYFKSKSFLFMVALFFFLIGIGLAYDEIFGVSYPINIRTLDDLTTGSVLTIVGGLGFILSIPAMWIVFDIKDKRNER